MSQGFACMCDFLMHTIFLFAIACDFWHVLFCFSVNVYTSVTVSNFLAISLLRVIAYFFAFYFFEFTYRKKKTKLTSILSQAWKKWERKSIQLQIRFFILITFTCRGEVIPICRLQRFMLSSSHDLCLTIGSYLSVRSSRYEAHRKFGEHQRCVRVAQGVAESNSSFLSALQTSQVLHISMNTQLMYEPIVL